MLGALGTNGRDEAAGSVWEEYVGVDVVIELEDGMLEPRTPSLTRATPSKAAAASLLRMAIFE